MMLVVALVLAVLFRTFLFQPFSIPSAAMKPTLLVGDYIFVSKYAYGYTHYSFPGSPHLFSGRVFAAQPQRGDVVVFRLPKNDATDYVKRIVGRPGDRIQMVAGVLHINGAPIKHERMVDFTDTSTGERVRQWRETLPERRVVLHTRSSRQWFSRQHPSLHSACRALFHAGRQSRQLDRQPRPGSCRLCTV